MLEKKDRLANMWISCGWQRTEGGVVHSFWKFGLEFRQASHPAIKKKYEPCRPVLRDESLPK